MSHVETTPGVFVHWRRNQIAVTAAAFIGFTGFTLVMPFLPLYFGQLGVDDPGDVAIWSGVSLGVTLGFLFVLLMIVRWMFATGYRLKE